MLPLLIARATKGANAAIRRCDENVSLVQNAEDAHEVEKSTKMLSLAGTVHFTEQVRHQQAKFAKGIRVAEAEMAGRAVSHCES